MLTYTSFKSLKVQARIYVAMRKAMITGIAQYVKNSKGQNYLRVKRQNNGIKAFTFTQGNKDLTNIVYKGLKA